jgi:glutathione peroxidase
MSCCGGSCCGGGKPWGLVVVVMAAAVAGAVTFMARGPEALDRALVQPVSRQSAEASGAVQPASEPGEPDVTKDPAYVLGYTRKLIDGTDQDLAAFKGKVVILVNVASQCGLTPQYEALERLYKAKKDSGLVILGFPANNFGSQEPGTNTEIAEFCRSNYGVEFPMFEKISVTGEDQDPLYKQLAGLPAPIGGDPKWNFTKFVVDRSGRVIARFEPRTSPDDKEFVAKIDELLAAK